MKASIDEEKLVLRVKNGERDEFRALVQIHQARVYAMINRVVRDDEAARDLAQETFIRAFQNLPKFRGDSSFGTWLTRIALNVTNNHLASRSYKNQRQTTVLQDDIYSSHDGDESHRIERNCVKLQELVAKLKPIYRDVLLLCVFEQRSYEEAAVILEIPMGTVRSRLNQARELLRQGFFDTNAGLEHI